ncbi:ATP-dependent Lon protease pim1, partial [Perkinsus olseni]
VELTHKATEALIRGYCREAGVRNLEKHVDKIMRKLSFKVAKVKEERLLIEEATARSEQSATTTGEAVEASDDAAEGSSVEDVEEEDVRKDPSLHWDAAKETGCDKLMRQIPEDVDCVITPKRLVDLVGKPA